MTTQTSLVPCPFCGRAVSGSTDFERAYDRVDHVLDHALRSSLGIDVDCLGGRSLDDACAIEDAVDWPSAVSLAMECVHYEIGCDLQEMYAFFGTLARHGVLGPMPSSRYATEFAWRHPSERVMAALNELDQRLR
jgi:hypothetical protein